VAQGVWNADGAQNIVVIRETSQREIVRFDPINVSVSLTDPFQELHPGDSGDGIFATGDVAGWTFDSR
jgi:hypothetical protein